MNKVNWTSAFVPKQEQRDKFILICHMLSPTDIKIWFDPVSHFLWQEMQLTVGSRGQRWMCDNLPCTQMNRREIEEIEKARTLLKDGMAIATKTSLSSAGSASLFRRADQALEALQGIK